MIVKYMGQRTLGGWVAIAICLTIISARTECEEFGGGFECGFFGDGVVFVMALSYGI